MDILDFYIKNKEVFSKVAGFCENLEAVMYEKLLPLIMGKTCVFLLFLQPSWISVEI